METNTIEIDVEVLKENVEKLDIDNGFSNTTLNKHIFISYTSSETADKNKVSELPHMIVPKSYFNINNRFIAIQKWEGFVVEIQNNNILVKLNDLTDPGIEEYGEFTFEDINPSDLELVKPGAIFYWSLGYEDYNGTRKKASYIRFRRLPPPAIIEIDKIKKLAQHLSNKIVWD